MRRPKVQGDRERSPTILADELQAVVGEDVARETFNLLHLAIKQFQYGIFGRTTSGTNTHEFMIAEVGWMVLVSGA